MASLIHLDTHVLVWLYLPRLDLLSDVAQDALRSGELEVSPMVVLELQYLHEIGRLRVPGREILSSLTEQLGVRLSRLEFGRVIHSALSETWTRDPFDRVIVGQARAAGAPLVTRDEDVRAGYDSAIW